MRSSILRARAHVAPARPSARLYSLSRSLFAAHVSSPPSVTPSSSSSAPSQPKSSATIGSAVSFPAGTTGLPPSKTVPPPPPEPMPTDTQDRYAWRKRNGNLLYGDGTTDRSRSVGEQPLLKRFWKDVSIVEADDKLQIHLDKRPLRMPSKNVISLPTKRFLLAIALAHEWDALPTSQHALKQHYIPLTSLISRAEGLECDESARAEVTKMCLRYLKTDTLLCWDPEYASGSADSASSALVVQPAHLTGAARGGDSLRSRQKKMADKVVGWLTTNVWPGVSIKPALDGASIFPRPQDAETVAVIESWINGLSAHDLAGLERAMLSSKSFLLAARLVAGWSSDMMDRRNGAASSSSASASLSGPDEFGIDTAHEAATVETRWQTDMWGEVEDTHDVDREDIRRQLGSVIVFVS